MNTTPPPRGYVYAYHATICDFLPSIAEQGLLARYDEDLAEDVIFVEPEMEEAAIYLEHSRGVMLRLTVDGIGSTSEGECVLWDTPRIDPSYIEVAQDNAWIPLTQAVATLPKDAQ